MSWCLEGVAQSCREADVGALLQSSLEERSWLRVPGLLWKQRRRVVIFLWSWAETFQGAITTKPFSESSIKGVVDKLLMPV